MYTYVTPIVIYCDKRQVCNEMDSTEFKLRVFLTKFGRKLLLSLSARHDYL